MSLRTLIVVVVFLLGLGLVHLGGSADAGPDAGTRPSSDERDAARIRAQIAEYVVGIERGLAKVRDEVRQHIKHLEERSPENQDREQQLSETQQELRETVARIKKSAQSHLELLEKELEQARARAKQKDAKSDAR